MEPAVLQGAPLSSGVDPGNTDPMEGFRKHQVILPIAHQDVSVMRFTFIFSLTFIFIAESSHSFDPPCFHMFSHSFTRNCFPLSFFPRKQFPFETRNSLT